MASPGGKSDLKSINNLDNHQSMLATLTEPPERADQRTGH